MIQLFISEFNVKLLYHNAKCLKGVTMLSHKFTVSTDELLSLTKVSRCLGQLIDQIKNKTLEKIIVLKNNEAEVAIIDLNEYLRLKSIADQAELMEVNRIVQSRKNTPLDSYISLDDMLTKTDTERKAKVAH